MLNLTALSNIFTILYKLSLAYKAFYSIILICKDYSIYIMGYFELLFHFVENSKTYRNLPEFISIYMKIYSFDSKKLNFGC